jgi:hypothetical protein
LSVVVVDNDVDELKRVLAFTLKIERERESKEEKFLQSILLIINFFCGFV